ncbi:MAG: hypothetical protein A2Y62_21180 [Candidatus Fischerbacteria bacterium RBG_13_37_8]|uniref:Uncharacterized protein n=1 Tax=Candidatus Fischerbacteria bacterium RBG_13_37_8 TaxID=1817863 RepID=A0A1F5V4Y5_9BACT|nr:MAG: hypothetical protein A2Y62_21180 [Candidatus Fischerbacteria bacterium RBG_13_37_8]
MKREDFVAEKAILVTQLEIAYKILQGTNEKSERKFRICQNVLTWLNEISLKVYYDDLEIKP